LLPYLPSATICPVLVTTRTTRWAKKDSVATTINNNDDNDNNINNNIMTTTDTATFEQPAKRVRINCGTGNDSAPTGPSAAARIYVSASTRSLPSDIQLFVQERNSKVNMLFSRQRQRKLTIARFDNEDYIPKPARISFELTATSSAKETEPFRALKTESDLLIRTAQLALKTAIRSVLDLEERVLKDELLKLFFDTVCQLSLLLFIFEYPFVKDPPTNALARFVLEKQRGSLYKFLPTTNASVFANFATYASDETAYAAGDTPDANATTFSKIIPKTQETLEAIFVRSWEEQNKVYDDRAKQDAVLKQLQHFRIGAATEDTAMQLDTEPTADATTIKDLVSSAVAAQTKKMEKELTTLRQQIKRHTAPSTNAQPKNTGSWFWCQLHLHVKAADTRSTTKNTERQQRQECWH
jgi:hypothetical protein